MLKGNLRGIVWAVLAACLLLGAGGVAAAAPANAGVVDYELLVTEHPDTPKANEALKAETEAAKKEFESKSAGLSDKDKQELDRQLWLRVEGKRRELLGAVMEKVNAAIKAVADTKGLSVVLDKSVVIYGGQDITAEVGKKFK